MIDREHALRLTRQATLLKLSRSGLYYRTRPMTPADLAVMRRIDELHLDYPFAGSRMLRDLLRGEGVSIGRQRVATMMKRDPTWKLTVTGHTDNVGGDASNLALSQRRSAAVKAALVSRGIAAGRLATGGSGAGSPKATNATLVGRAQNRRVELSRQ